MTQTPPKQTLVSEEELLALPSPPRRASPLARASVAGAAVDVWFKYRMIFLLAVVVAYTGKLLFWPALATANFDLGDSHLSLDSYFRIRAGLVITITGIYLYSYLKDWHFEQVSLLVLGVSVTALVLDYFNAYVHLSQTPTQWITGLIALRFLAIFCLLMNAMSARHAPPMPRRLWS